FTFFPSFPANGGVERYTGEFVWYHGPWSLSGNYVQLLTKRNGVAASQPAGGVHNLAGNHRQGWLFASQLHVRRNSRGKRSPREPPAIVRPGGTRRDGGRQGSLGARLPLRQDPG